MPGVSMDKQERGSHRWFLVKICFMLLLCLGDLGLNSSVEFDDFTKGDTSTNAKNILVLVFGLQLVLQISTFLTLFLMMGDTYLFRVGLLGVLAKQFTGVLLLHPFYIGYTMALGGYRVAELHKEGFEMNQLWELPYFVPLSVCHKIVAAIYYVANLRSTIKLGSPLYYNKDAWVEIFYDANRDTSRVEQSESLLRRRRVK
ncbi:hypothetical protein TrLO_g14473 [Triparma laevis f. longispina]|uniref:Transmembrane protein 138 n=1 Tax=Triparma laevis f. longispina TaxID=1714387 RepID=A0A9W7A8R9_9STRA|nr:hypothetical protein TrLO_g14473 [Triparma laevis f. longispina]